MDTNSNTVAIIPSPKSALDSSPKSAMGYLDKALKTLAPLGLVSKPTNETVLPIISLVSQLQVVDENSSVLIARTLQYGNTFNEAIRAQISDMKIGERHETIANNFKSILEDAQKAAGQIEENKVNTIGAKFGRLAMKITRGSVHSRFNKIKKLSDEVSAETKSQLDKESIILEAYLDYRGALSEACISTAQVLKVQSERLENSKGELSKATDFVSTVPDQETENKARAQLARDEAHRDYQNQDRLYQLAKELSEQTSNLYHASEVVMANLAQTRNVKNSVYTKGVLFFHTADGIMAGLDANLTSTAGLQEQTRAINATSDGINEGFKVLAKVGMSAKKEAIKTAYSSTLKSESVKILIDSIVAFQSESIKAIEEYRTESTNNTKQIASIVDDGKERLSKLVSNSSTFKLES